MSWPFVYFPIDLTGLSLLLVLLACAHSVFFFGEPRHTVVWPVIIWLLFFPAVLLNPSELGDGVKILTLYGVTFPLAIAPFFLMRSAQQRKMFVWALAGIAFFSVLNGLVFNRSLANNYSDVLVLEGTDTIASARLAFSAMLAFLIVSLFPERSARVRIALVACAMLSGFFAISTGSRGPALSAVAALGVVLLIAPAFRNIRARSLLIFGSAIAVITPIALLSASDGMDRIISAILGQGDTSTQARERIWTNALNVMSEHPLGTGWGAFEKVYRGYHPHNLVLELGVSTGLIVTMIFLAFWMLSLLRGIRSADTPEGSVLLALLITSTLNSLVSSDINSNRLLVVCMFAVWAIRAPQFSRPNWRTPVNHHSSTRVRN